MDINQFNRAIRQAVNKENAALWQQSPERKQFCRELLGEVNTHEVVISILVDVIDELLQRKAEDMFADYPVGEGVTILESGHCIPATIIEHDARDETLIVQLDKIFPDGHFEPDVSGDVIDFHRSHDKVYVHIEGRALSRLVGGRKYLDYSHEHLKEEMEQLSGAKAS